MLTGPSAQWLEKMLMSSAVLTCTGQYQVTVENYRKIRCLTEDLVELQSATCRIRIKGKNLKLNYFTKEIMKITGQIDGIEYIM